MNDAPDEIVERRLTVFLSIYRKYREEYNTYFQDTGLFISDAYILL